MPIVQLTAFFLLTPLAIQTTSPLPSAVQSSPYSTQLVASGGVLPYVWTIVSGTLSTGLSLSALGLISGTPANAETDGIVVKVTDATGAFITASFVLVVAPVIVVNTVLPQGVKGTPYSDNFQATGGTLPLTWTLNGQTGVNVWSITPQGAITGTPGTAETDTFNMTATDFNGFTGSAIVSLTVLQVLQILGITLPQATPGVPYSQDVSGQASGGTPPYTFSKVSQTGPDNWNVSVAGIISGTVGSTGTPLVTGANVPLVNETGVQLVT